MQRDEWREAMEPAIQAITADPENFGSLRLDDSGDWWRLHIYYVGDNLGRADVEPLLPAGAPVEWTQVKYNYATIEKTHREIRDMARGFDHPIFNFIRTDVWNNRVIVSIPPNDSAVAVQIRSTYPEDLVLVILEDNKPMPL